MIRTTKVFGALTVLAGALAFAPLPPHAPPYCLGPVLTQLRIAKTRADSLLAAKPSEDKAASGDACAKFIVGFVVGMASTPSEEGPEWRERQHALELLEGIQRDFGDDPRWYLAMGIIRYNGQERTD
ncbi:MAG TPA: hypothetical protein VGI83_05065, partial [Gemmatimonadales bacterium]